MVSALYPYHNNMPIYLTWLKVMTERFCTKGEGKLFYIILLCWDVQQFCNAIPSCTQCHTQLYIIVEQFTSPFGDIILAYGVDMKLTPLPN